MKNKQVWVILLLIVLFLYLKPSAYAASPPGPIKYKVIQGGKLPELAPVPKSNKLLTNYRNIMEKYCDALEKSYVTTAQGVEDLKMTFSPYQRYDSLVRNFIAHHNAYFKATPTTDVCSWVLSVLNIQQNPFYMIKNLNDPGMKPLIPFLGNDSLTVLSNNIESSFGSSC